MQYKLLKTVLTISLLFIGLLTFCFTHSKESQPIKPQTVLVFGDSLSAAYNIKPEEGWVSLLQNFIDEKKYNIKLVNASISGETTSDGLKRLKKALTNNTPDVVILELGGNDGLRGFNLSETQKNLSQMIQLSHQANAKVLLAGIQLPPNMGRTYTKRFANIYYDLEKRENVFLIPFILEGVAIHSKFMQQDGIHPNADGQPIIAKNVWKYLSSLMIQ